MLPKILKCKTVHTYVILYIKMKNKFSKFVRVKFQGKSAATSYLREIDKKRTRGKTHKSFNDWHDTHSRVLLAS